MTDLAEIFNEEVEAEPAAEIIAEVTPEPEKEPEAESTGEIEPQVSPPEPEIKEESKNVPIAALMAEREKRQTLQKQVDEFNLKKQEEPAPDMFDDQTKYTEHMNAKMQTAMFNERANLSEFYARKEHSDLDAKVEKFQQLKADNPALAAQVQGAASPYHEIEDIVAKHEKMEKFQNIDDFEATTRAELESKIRAEITAEMNGKVESKEALKSSVPTSLVSESSKGAVQGASWSGPSDLESIFGD